MAGERCTPACWAREPQGTPRRRSALAAELKARSVQVQGCDCPVCTSSGAQMAEVAEPPEGRSSAGQEWVVPR